MKRLAIDPGDRHVGWAHYRAPDDIAVGEWSPSETCWAIIHLMTRNEVDEVIFEEYTLYSSHVNPQIGSNFPTVQLIGSIKLICAMFRIPWHEQGAYIKTATRGQMRGRGIKHLGTNIHMKDAELHLWHRVLRSGEVPK